MKMTGCMMVAACALLCGSASALEKVVFVGDGINDAPVLVTLPPR